MSRGLSYHGFNPFERYRLHVLPTQTSMDLDYGYGPYSLITGSYSSCLLYKGFLLFLQRRTPSFLSKVRSF